MASVTVSVAQTLASLTALTRSRGPILARRLNSEFDPARSGQSPFACPNASILHMPPIMNAFRCSMPRLICWISLPLLATPLLAGVQAVHGATPATASPKPAEPNPGIIPLPLMPIVSASQRACAAKTPSGLGYTMLRAGAGAQPAGEDTVLVNYVGYLAATGAVFDQNMQTPMPVGGVIPGFSEGLQLLSRAAIVRLCIPAAMAYGEQASDTIPANSDLVFQVELLDFKTAAEIAEMRNAQGVQPPGQGEADPQP